MTEKHDDSHIDETHDGGEARPTDQRGPESRPSGDPRPDVRRTGDRRLENRPAGDRRPESRVRRPPTPAEADPLAGAVDEARKFLGSIQRRIGREIGKGMVEGSVAGIGQTLGFGRPAGRPAAGDVWSDAVAERHDEEYICRACPVCRMKAARREAGADVTDHLIAAGGELFAAVRQAVVVVSRPPAPGASGATGGSSGDRDTRVQHIDLG
ncbi:hypothetical protein GCM10009677_57950 [Sphaerisporangium rubeum]|uniref:Uncharacterized protein n=1 Tax=Sphaerisporangium rubeum TaxID=321317 RepID=A0A7X0M7B9_9ACTN|nr:hypothetical protein [Sphaerisporangium rubeum]MBB6474633.1 hypothetical protein [Sphaerisporangium rubeum]